MPLVMMMMMVVLGMTTWYDINDVYTHTKLTDDRA
jgi:hypothetical protein